MVPPAVVRQLGKINGMQPLTRHRAPIVPIDESGGTPSPKIADRLHRPRDGIVGIEVRLPRLDGRDGEAEHREGRFVLRPSDAFGVMHGKVENARQRDLAIGRAVGIVSGLPWRVNEHRP